MNRNKRILGGVVVCGMAAQLSHAAAAGGAAGGGDMTHRMMMLVVQLGILLFVARLGGFLFEKLKLPGVLGELASGIVVGPYLLGSIPFAGFAHGVFPLFSETFPIYPELYGFCTVASIVLLFMVGLETDIKLFMRYSVAGSLVGIGGVVVSFLVGNLMGVWLLPTVMDGHFGPLSPACIFLGVMSTATSVGITARVLSDKRKLDSPEGVTILAGAVIDDVLGIILLAVGLGIISASSAGGDGVAWGGIGIIAAKAVGIWVAATVLGLVASRRIGALLKGFGEESSIAIMALGLALILSGLFEEARLAMIIGAYVMGLSLSRTDISHLIRENLHVIYRFLVPVFFAVMGMLVDVRLLMSREVLLFGMVYTLGAIAAKTLGCSLPALACGFNVRGALRIGSGMLPRGEVALIVAGIGLAAGLISPEVFGIGVLMTLVTTLLAPPLLVKLFESPASGLRHPRVLPASVPLVFTFASGDTTELLAGKLTEAFRGEGFFVHTLNHEEHISQLRKDRTVIGFQRKGNQIIFDCEDSERTFVNTAMLEVLTELEQTVSELRRPMDHASIARGIGGPGAPGAPAAHHLANLGPYIKMDLLIPHLDATDKEGVIREMVQRLADRGQTADPVAALQAVLDRETVMSTGMQDGIAIPHARTDTASRLVCAVGLKPEGVAFDSLDGQPAQIFVLALSPKSVPAPHMQFMATVANCLDADGRRALLLCRTPEQMAVVLRGDLGILNAHDQAIAEGEAPDTPERSHELTKEEGAPR